MIDENGRPGRIAGDNQLIARLIVLNEEKAALMSDRELEAALEVQRQRCAELGPKIEEARAAYQVPSQAFYVFDRILHRRRLNAEITRAID